MTREVTYVLTQIAEDFLEIRKTESTNVSLRNSILESLMGGFSEFGICHSLRALDKFLHY